MPKTIKKDTTNKKTTVAKKAVSKVAKKTTTPKVVAKKETIKTARYLNKDIQLSPRKLRLLVDEVRKTTPVEALARLKFVNTKAARILVKALKNIIADAKNNFNLDINTLKFETIKADEAMKLKRMDKSHSSRFARGIIQKRHSRLLIIVKGVQQ